MNSKTTQLLIGLSLLALVAVAGYAYASSYVSSLNEKTTLLRNDIQYSELKRRQLDVLRRAVADTGDEKEKIASYFIASGGAVSFVSSLESMASRGGLAYSTNSIETRSQPELDAQGKELLHIVFSASGSWSSVMKLISLIETLPYSVNIEAVDLTAEGSAAMQPEVSGSSTPAAPSVGRIWKAAITFSVIKIKYRHARQDQFISEEDILLFSRAGFGLEEDIRRLHDHRDRFALLERIFLHIDAAGDQEIRRSEAERGVCAISCGAGRAPERHRDVR